MKPPAPEAIENALAHLIDSIILENGTNHYLDSECREAVRVDNIIEAFQVTMNALQKKVDHIVSHYKSHRNNVVPFISRLPNEILGRIFSLAVPPRLWSVKKLHQLALVCKSWFRTVKSTPDLWALVLHDMMMLNPTLEHVAIALRLSKSAPLTLLFRNEQKSQNPSSRLVTQDVGLTSHKLTLAADHVNRWRSFTFHGRSTQSVLHALEHPELTLETLEIAWPAEYDSLFPSFSLAYGDRLRHLSLSNVTARCSSFQGLVTLRLNNTSSIHQIAWLPPFSQVVETLEASPHLEVLTLQQTLDPLSGEDPFEILFDQETGSPKPPSSRAIHLPRLQCLVLRNLPYIATHYLLQYIHSDALTRVRIRARNTESPFYLAQSFGFWTDDNPHTAANALDRLPKHHKLGIWHNGNSVFAWATPGSEKSIMDVTQDDIEHSRTPYFEVRFTDSGDEVEGEGPMKDIADVCNLSAITVRPVTLYFSPQAANTPPTDVLAAVQSMPLTLKLLNLWNLPWETCVTVLQHLSRPLTTRNKGDLQWPYPRLKQIHLPPSLVPSAVAAVINHRWAQTRPEATGGSRVFFGDGDADRPISIVIILNNHQTATDLNACICREVAGGRSYIEPSPRGHVSSWNIRFELPVLDSRLKKKMSQAF